MTEFLAARLQMAVSLGFHIIFACIGMAMPFFMFVAEYKWIKTGNEVYKTLAKAWSRGVAIFFAVGAVSGTVLSFELGLLWPEFMKHAGAIIGMPFSWEGTAFFVEAIALGLFLYGWNKLGKYTHLFAGLVVGVSGVLSGIFVVSANAWMNSPAGFDWVNGEAINIDPVKAMFNSAWLSQSIHMTLASFASTGFAVAGLHAFFYLKGKQQEFHSKAIQISILFAAVAALLQPLSGDFSAKDVAKRQPAKLAAMESHFHTSAPADLIIGGIPNEETQEVKMAIKIPGMLSFLAHGNFKAEVTGLDKFPKEEHPPVVVVHFAFQIMVFCGMIMAGTALLYFLFRFRFKRLLNHRKWHWLLILNMPLGFIALEAGWTVTETGRQPWIIYGIMKTSEAITPMPGIQYSFYYITALYVLLSMVIMWLMARQIRYINNEI